MEEALLLHMTALPVFESAVSEDRVTQCSVLRTEYVVVDEAETRNPPGCG